MKAVVAAFNQEKALVGAFSVITNLRMDLFEALLVTRTQDTKWETDQVLVKSSGSGDNSKQSSLDPAPQHGERGRSQVRGDSFS